MSGIFDKVSREMTLRDFDDSGQEDVGGLEEDVLAEESEVGDGNGKGLNESNDTQEASSDVQEENEDFNRQDSLADDDVAVEAESSADDPSVEDVSDMSETSNGLAPLVPEVGTIRSSYKKSEPKLRQVRDVPDSMIQAAQKRLGQSATLTDTVTAFIALETGVVDDLSSDQLRLVREAQDIERPLLSIESHLDSLQEEVSLLRKHLSQQVSAVVGLKILMAYMLQDRLGFLNQRVDVIEDVNLNTEALSNLQAQLDKELERFMQADRLRKGREAFDPRMRQLKK